MTLQCRLPFIVVLNLKCARSSPARSSKVVWKKISITSLIFGKLISKMYREMYWKATIKIHRLSLYVPSRRSSLFIYKSISTNMSGEINCEEIVIIFFFTKLSYPRDSKETSWSLSQSAICQHMSTTRGECFAFFFCCWTSSKEAVKLTKWWVEEC